MDFGFACTLHHAVELAAIELRDEALDPSSDEERMSSQQVGGGERNSQPTHVFRFMPAAQVVPADPSKEVNEFGRL